jgi:metal-responsive CopG/Arc/MetJ family transcriptional regulator
MANANISLDEIILKEIDDIVDSTSKYRNRSHFFQVAAENLLEEEARAGGA